MLWVDRNRPHKFTDLVGNEKVARDAMAWVKEWDFCVFGKSKGRKRSRDDQEDEVNTDPFRRPKEKVTSYQWDVLNAHRCRASRYSFCQVPQVLGRRLWLTLWLVKRDTKSWKLMQGSSQKFH